MFQSAFRESQILWGPPGCSPHSAWSSMSTRITTWPYLCGILTHFLRFCASLPKTRLGTHYKCLDDKINDTMVSPTWIISGEKLSKFQLSLNRILNNRTVVAKPCFTNIRLVEHHRKTRNSNLTNFRIWSRNSNNLIKKMITNCWR